jgi:hypothetical protein
MMINRPLPAWFERDAGPIPTAIAIVMVIIFIAAIAP